MFTLHHLVNKLTNIILKVMSFKSVEEGIDFVELNL